ncbi:signal recognition particle-docking protein FtsY [Candidatus Micrarchaeota archaeon]|nr:signal recognition particle-docking protein FtsY [Candidatus Micrarchaeota archaeon]
MFDFLKKKISGFIDNVVGKAKSKEDSGAVTDSEVKKIENIEEIPEKVSKGFGDIELVKEEIGTEIIEEKIVKEEKKVETPRKKQEVVKKDKEKAKEEVKKAVEKKMDEKKEKVVKEHSEKDIPTEIVKPKKVEIVVKKDEKIKEELEEKKTIGKEVAPIKEIAVQEPVKKKDEKKVSLSLITKVKSIFSNEVELSEKDISSVLEDFELSLLESDVAFDVAEQIKDDLRRELIGKRLKKGELSAEVNKVFANSIERIMGENKGVGIPERIAGFSSSPVKIMFTGPNGSGKTTTIAKIAKMLIDNGYSVVVAAADTFRAAAIEQMEIHGEKLGVRVIAGRYGADPTSVAFDAVNYAKAHKINVVLIDTAGRQETNQNLLNELKKMVRVIAPELKIYVGESIAGNSIIEQVSAFNQELGLDGVILTKLDCDAKGGTVISISKVTKVPVLYITVGQGYGDIESFDEKRIAENIAG